MLPSRPQSEYSWAKRYPQPTQLATIETIVRFLNEDENGWLLSRYYEESSAAEEEGEGDDFPSPFGWMLQTHTLEFLEYGVAFEDLKPLEILTEVANLEIEVAPNTDLSPLANLKSLRRLWLYGAKDGDYSFLADLPDLEELRLKGDGGRNLSAIQSCPKLKKLYMFVTDDLSVVHGATNLELLDVHGSWVTDISPLAGLRALEYLFIQDNLIRDISVLKELPSLMRLELSRNCITDFSVLDELPRFQQWVREELRNSQQLNGTHALLQPILKEPRNLQLWAEYARWLISIGDPLGNALKDKLEGGWNQLPNFWAMGDEIASVRRDNDEWFYRNVSPIVSV
jgi:hypothetical protein